MNQTAPKIVISHNDRLGMTLFLAISLHLLIILGISFTPEDESNNDVLATLDITLVQQQSEKEPDKADYLAQANQQGSGNTSEKVKHKAVQNKASPDQTQGQADINRSASKIKKAQNNTQVLTQESSATKVITNKKQPKTKNTKILSAQELIKRSKQIARLSAQNDASWQAYSQLPDSKYLYANTKSHTDAAYLAAWTRKVKKIGNMNYPRKNKTGHLMIEVALNPNGSLIGIQILKSSRHKVLDKAAVDIVRLAAPFAPVPKEVLQDRKTLRIVRTWVFTNDNKLQSR